MENRVGPFELLAPLGRGAMGEVWRARHRLDRGEAAVKLLRSEGVTDALRQAFDAEIRLVAALSHPRVVRILDAGVADGAPWFAMSLLPGGDLWGLRGKVGWPELRKLLLDVLDALAHAHARGVLHLDLKPANILFDARRRAVVSDFGIGRRLGQRNAAIEAGTPRYMAPEQFRRDAASLAPATDLYALGCVAWVLATGRPPFAAPTFEGLAELHTQAALPAFEPACPLPRNLGAWLALLLAKDPLDRFRCAADARAALLAIERRSPSAEPVACPPTPGRDEPPPAHLPGAGVALFGVRTLPMVGREEERRILWDALRAVHAEGRPRVVLLQGPAGIGKSRLARWLVERADELGAAQAWCVPAGSDLLETSEMEGSAADRQARAIRELMGRASERVLALWLDDALTAPLVGLLERITRSRAMLPLPALIVATASTEELDARPELAARWHAIDASRSSIGPLAPGAHRKLVGDLLGLRSSLAAEVIAQTQGSPLFAVELVRSWVARGALVPTRHGWRLAKGEVVALPDALYPVWQQRLDAAMVRRSPPDRAALAIAAALGHEVSLAEWRAACAEAELPASSEMLATLADHRLIVLRPDRFRFAHAAFRAAIERQAAEAGRWSGAHAACAAVVPEAEPARLGRHLAAAGRPADAVPLLIEGAARTRMRAGDEAGALALVREAERCLDRIEAPAADPLRMRAAVMEARILAYQRRAPEGTARILRAIEAANAAGRPSAAAEVTCAWLFTHTGDLTGSLWWLAQARSHLAHDPDPDTAVALAIQAGQCAYFQGDHDAALRFAAEARRLWRPPVSPTRLGSAWFATASSLHALGRVPDALAALDESTAAFHGRSHPGLAMCANLRHSLLFESGRVEEALAGWEAEILRQEEVGATEVLALRLNLTHALLGLGRVGPAAAQLAHIRMHLGREAPPPVHVAGAEALDLWLAVLEERWDDATDGITALEEALGRLAIAETDLPETLERVAAAADRAGQSDLAARAWRAAASRWELAGRADRAALGRVRADPSVVQGQELGRSR
jgi:tetratricopeptide (TPR) repeat protein